MKKMSLLLSIFPIVSILLLTVLRFSSFGVYSFLIQEDGLFEWIQFLMYFFSGLSLAVCGGMQIQRKNTYLALLCVVAALALTFVAFEEMSWGQRISHTQTPSYFMEHNTQAELTIHNLDIVQPIVQCGYLFLGIFLAVVHPMSLFFLKTFSIFKKKKTKTMLLSLIQIFAPPTFLMGYFLPLAAIYAILIFYQPFGIILDSGIPVMGWRDQEVGETFLAMGIFIQCLRIYSASKKQKKVL